MSSGEYTGSPNSGKKLSALRYPDAFHAAVSQQLMAYRLKMGDMRRTKAAQEMDTLINFCTLDYETGYSIYSEQLKDKQLDPDNHIRIPEPLVKRFKKIMYEGLTDERPDLAGIPAFYFLSAPKGYSPKDGHVFIRKPVQMLKAWGDRPKEYTQFVGNYNYKIVTIGEGGMPITTLEPSFDWDDPDIEGLYTNTPPTAFYVEVFDAYWIEIKPIMDIIERFVAQNLFERGYYIESDVDKADPITRPTPESGGDSDEDGSEGDDSSRSSSEGDDIESDDFGQF